MSYVIHPRDFSSQELGGKAQALAALDRSGIPVPGWFVLSPDAFDRSLGEREQRILQEATDSAAMVSIVERLMPAPEVRLALDRALSLLCPGGERVAVRSSAMEEDGSRHSFAGQFESFLFVRPEDAADKVAKVWRSAFSERALVYRRARGLSLIPQPPAVLIQRMINADCSGVAFGADPVSGRRGVAVVAALYGLGTALVSGECDADTYHVDREGRIVSRTIAVKRLGHRYDQIGRASCRERV